MSKKFLIAVEGLNEEFWVEAASVKEAKKLLWEEYLTQWQRESVVSMEVIDEKHLTTYEKLVRSRKFCTDLNRTK